MRRVLAWAFAAILLAQPSWPQQVPVRSGDHADFTRLTFALPRTLEWELTRTPQGARLVFPAAALEFDTTAVFDRIARTRLIGLKTAAGNTVNLRFGCACDVNAFWHDERLLVLDIRDPVETAQQSQDRGTRTAPMPDATGPGTASDVPSFAGALAARALSLPYRAGEAGVASADPVPPERTEQDPALLDQTRAKLLRQLGRATNQGLLSMEVAANHLAAKEPAGEESDVSPPDSKPPNPPRPQANVKVSTAIDRAFVEALRRADSDAVAATCLPAKFFDVRSWAKDEPFTAQVGHLRAKLTDSADRVRPAQALALAKLYIHHGFGTEAREILSMLDGADREVRVLRAIARIIDHGQVGGDSILRGQLHCESAAALWSVLSYREPPGEAQAASDAVLRSLRALPRALRAHLAPRLARNLLAGGHRDLAEKILSAANRTASLPETETRALKAELALAEGETEDAARQLRAVAEAGAANSARALARLVEIQIAERRPIPRDLAELAGAYALENRDGRLSADTARAYVLALAASGQFDRAFATADRMNERLGTASGDVRGTMAGLLADDADDITFLRHVFAGSVGRPADLDDKIGNRVAARLLKAGFTERASRVLAGGAEADAGRARRLLRAEIALAQDLPRQALADLLGLVGRDANLLRAQARSLAGDHAAARELFEASGDSDRARREAWLAGEWRALSDTEDPARASLATALQGPAPDTATGTAPEKVLARNRALLEQSDALDAALSKFLEAGITRGEATQ